MELTTIFHLLGACVVIAPLLLTTILGLCSLLDRPLGERAIIRLTQAAVMGGLLSAIAMLGLMLISGSRHVPVELGEWVSLPDLHFHFHIKFVFDRLSVPFAILTFALVGTIGAFASSYMHREPGFNRFFVLYAVFLLGMILTTLAGAIETLFVGWELVGLSSAFLVAFFQNREAPVRNSLRLWSVYRVSDAALLIAAVALHHIKSEGDFDRLMGAGPWPDGLSTLTSSQALCIGLLLLAAAAGKSALAPFSGWLPRAMEGPTPSSAIFYGALSVHLGAFLLLRVSPILEQSTLLCAAVVALGLATAALAALAGRAQTDIKSALAYASLTQVGIIVAEIGLGLRYIALAHIIGHACLRTLQLLRAPTLLHDYHSLENALGSHLPHTHSAWERMLSAPSRAWWYRFALERAYFDAILSDYVAYPFLKLFRTFEDWERRWTGFLSGAPGREPDHARVSTAWEDVQ